MNQFYIFSRKLQTLNIVVNIRERQQRAITPLESVLGLPHLKMTSTYFNCHSLTTLQRKQLHANTLLSFYIFPLVSGHQLF